MLDAVTRVRDVINFSAIGLRPSTFVVNSSGITFRIETTEKYWSLHFSSSSITIDNRIKLFNEPIQPEPEVILFT